MVDCFPFLFLISTISSSRRYACSSLFRFISIPASLSLSIVFFFFFFLFLGGRGGGGSLFVHSKREKLEKANKERGRERGWFFLVCYEILRPLTIRFSLFVIFRRQRRQEIEDVLDPILIQVASPLAWSQKLAWSFSNSQLFHDLQFLVLIFLPF